MEFIVVLRRPARLDLSDGGGWNPTHYKILSADNQDEAGVVNVLNKNLEMSPFKGDFVQSLSFWILFIHLKLKTARLNWFF